MATTKYIVDNVSGQTINGESVQRPYKVYSGLIAQYDSAFSGEPQVIVLENTIGEIVWTRVGAGDYRGTLAGAFPDNKTVCFATVGGNQGSNGYINLCKQPNNNDSLRFQFIDPAIGRVDINSEYLGDIFYECAIEIRVYP